MRAESSKHCMGTNELPIQPNKTQSGRKYFGRARSITIWMSHQCEFITQYCYTLHRGFRIWEGPRFILHKEFLPGSSPFHWTLPPSLIHNAGLGHNPALSPSGKSSDTRQCPSRGCSRAWESCKTSRTSFHTIVRRYQSKAATIEFHPRFSYPFDSVLPDNTQPRM